MPKAEDKIPDPRDDYIGTLLEKLSAMATWNSEKWALAAQIKREMLADGYVSFDSFSSSYHLSVVGDSCLFDLSPKHNGKLKPYAGQRVRVVCTGSGPRWKRKFMAKLA